MNTLYKNESFILFTCILIIIFFNFVYSLYNFLYKYACNYKKYNSYNKKMEKFRGSSESKRDRMIKIFKDDTNSDNYDTYDANNDPDGTYGSDPDS